LNWCYIPRAWMKMADRGGLSLKPPQHDQRLPRHLVLSFPRISFNCLSISMVRSECALAWLRFSPPQEL
jgi:hypothetical protein